jgi:hypothetical protein
LAATSNLESLSLFIFNPLNYKQCSQCRNGTKSGDGLPRAVYVDGRPVDVIHFSGDSNQTVPVVVGMMKEVELGHAGLGGSAAPTPATSMLTRQISWIATSLVASTIMLGPSSGTMYHQLLRIFVVDNKDQATVLRELGDKFRQNHKLCSTPSIESDFCVALERGGLPPGTFSNVNSYGADVVSKLLP